MLEKWLHDLIDRLIPLRDRLARSRSDDPLRRRLLALLNRVIRWRPKGLTRKSAIVLIASLIVIPVSIGVIIWELTPAPDPDRPKPAWFYDVKTGQLHTGMSNDVTSLREGEVVVRPHDAAPSGQHDPGKAVADPAEDHPPAAAPVARTTSPLVRAYVYSCGSCDDPRQRFVGFLETYTPEAHQAIITRPPDREGVPPVDIDEIVQAGHLVAAPPHRGLADSAATTQAAGITWHLLHSDQGATIVEVANTGCPGETMPTLCEP